MTLYRLITEEEEKEINKDIESIRRVYQINIPEKFELFLTTFKSGQYTEKWAAYLDNSLRIHGLTEINFKKRSEITIDYGWIFSSKEIAYDLAFNDSIKSNIEDHGMIRIGNIIAGGGLFLGIGEHNKDKIYRIIWDIDKVPLFIADNIFSFLKGLKVTSKDLKVSPNKSVNEKYFTFPNFKPILDDELKNSVQSKLQSLTLDKSINSVSLFKTLNEVFDEIRSKNN